MQCLNGFYPVNRLPEGKFQRGGALCTAFDNVVQPLDNPLAVFGDFQHFFAGNVHARGQLVPPLCREFFRPRRILNRFSLCFRFVDGNLSAVYSRLNGCAPGFFGGDGFGGSICCFLINEKAAFRRFFLLTVARNPLINGRQLVPQQFLLRLHIVTLYVCTCSYCHIEAILRNGGVRPCLHCLLLCRVDRRHLAFECLVECNCGGDASR